MIDGELIQAAAAGPTEERAVRPVRRPVPRDLLADFLRAFGLVPGRIVEGEHEVVIVAQRSGAQPHDPAAAAAAFGPTVRDFLESFGLRHDSTTEQDAVVVLVAARNEEQPDDRVEIQEHRYDLDLGATLGIPSTSTPASERDAVAAVVFGDLPPGFGRL